MQLILARAQTSSVSSRNAGPSGSAQQPHKLRIVNHAAMLSVWAAGRLAAWALRARSMWGTITTCPVRITASNFRLIAGGVVGADSAHSAFHDIRLVISERSA